MTCNFENPNDAMEADTQVRLPYQAPQLIVIPPFTIESDQGFSSDAGFEIGGS